jgi:AraC-like DNA-binding protein
MVEILLALEHPFLFRAGDTEWTKTSAVAVGPGVLHQSRDLRGYVASIRFLPERRWSIPLHFLDSRKSGEDLEFFRSLPSRDSTCSEVFRHAEQMATACSGSSVLERKVDGRVLNVLERIESMLTGRIRLRDLAYTACLSEDRFLHLFKEQLGITLRQYVVHQRLQHATVEILGGKTLTRAALDSGFADSSHFTRRFAEHSGFLPRLLKGQRGDVSVLTCSSSRCLRTASGADGNGVCAECAAA